MHLSGSRPTKPRSRQRMDRRPWPTFSAGLALFFVSLTLVMRVYALPAEAHITETWYSYKQDLAYDFKANVQTGSIYKKTPIDARDLLQLRMPTEPPSYRRLTVAKLTDSLRLSLPYQFTAEQEAEIQVTYRIDGSLIVPNLWQRPYQFLDKTVVSVKGKKVVLDQLQVEIPIKQLLAELAQLTEATKINQEQAEIRVRPVFEVKVNGLREPVTAALAPEITLNIRGANYAIEIDEPQTFHGEQTYEVNVVLPATVNILGYRMEVNLLRQLLTTLAVVVASATAGVLAIHWLRKKATMEYDVKRLGSQLIQASKFEISATAAIADLSSLRELLQLQIQLERPVIQVGQTYYLADESVCYRFTMPEPELQPDPESQPEPESQWAPKPQPELELPPSAVAEAAVANDPEKESE